MIKKNKLINTRNNKGYSQECMAAYLNINKSSYSRKENGEIHIHNYEWKKLSEVLEVPFEEIYESEDGMIFIFNDNSTGNGNNVTNYTIPNSVWESQKKYIEKLEEENQNLKDEIIRLKQTATNL